MAPDSFRRALLGEKAAGLVAELFLIVGEIEIHGAYSFVVVVS
jgi:hypothetical protein